MHIDLESPRVCQESSEEPRQAAMLFGRTSAQVREWVPQYLELYFAVWGFYLARYRGRASHVGLQDLFNPISKSPSFTGFWLEARLLAKALPQVAQGNGFSLV
jgi:hypothetical protein